MYKYKYDFGLSFAGAQRNYAENFADELKNRNITVFYDNDERANLWGENLYQKFQKLTLLMMC